jgi:hypothetical protein
MAHTALQLVHIIRTLVPQARLHLKRLDAKHRLYRRTLLAGLFASGLSGNALV